jgi:peptide methionine sulfoxide reductase MsrA
VEAERKWLKRSDSQLTALAGYAGGNGGMRDGKVCYHNALQVSEYGSLGHAEVVRLRIPPSSFRQFATEYFALFDAKGNRPDQFGDRGLEYRNLVGIPGGKDSPLAKELVEVSAANGDKLDFIVGKGTDPDARAMAFIMDSTKFPFYQGEVYHQFHDGFKLDENYPNSYNRLTPQLVKEGRIVDQGCPNGMVGLGFGGL